MALIQESRARADGSVLRGGIPIVERQVDAARRAEPGTRGSVQFVEGKA